MTTRKKLEPRFANRRAVKLAGISVHYDVQNGDAFAKQWQSFIPLIDTIPSRVGAETYGVVLGSFGGHAGFEYITGVEVSSLDKVAAKLRRLEIPAQRYAVFVHEGHVSGIRETMYSVKKEWLPKMMVPGRTDTSREGGNQPDFFERYGKDFDPKTATGKIELWVPLKR
ncbi:MAG TPA: GyrI-like domain-containing protein [Gemmatimonadaceae bacterium]|nr:GyrI-like domain-containing protein [Gemmatimonadaceae bacterium]